MRYAIGMSKIDPSTKMISSPYLMCLNYQCEIEANVNIGKQLSGCRLLIMDTPNGSTIQYLRRKYKEKGMSFYPIKIDSLNFPYHLSKQKHIAYVDSIEKATYLFILGTRRH